MGPIFRNRYLDALAKTLVIFGTLHWVILLGVCARGNVEALNAFNIVQLTAILPGVGHGLVNFVLSYCAVVAGYWLAYRYLARPTPAHEFARREIGRAHV